MKEYERGKLFHDGHCLVYHIKTAKKNMQFRCENWLNDTLLFVNNSNDFPKQIIYVQPKGSSMSVWVNNFEEDPNEMRFPFKKIGEH